MANENGNRKWYATVGASVASGLIIAAITAGILFYKNTMTRSDLDAAQTADARARETLVNQVFDLQKQLLQFKEEQIKRGPSVAKIPTLEAGLDALNQKFAALAVAQEQLTRMREDISGMRQDLKDLTKELKDVVLGVFPRTPGK